MKETLIIVAVTAIGAGVGLYIRDHSAPPARAAALTALPETKPTKVEAMSRTVTVTEQNRYGRVEETTLADGRRQVQHYNSNGSKGMQITYGNERSPTMPSGSAAPYQGNYGTGGGSGGAAPAARC